MKFEKEKEKGEHFFQATLVQTLFYGVFSSWVLWSREKRGQPAAKFNWHDAAWTLHVPMIKGLFEQIATPTKLKPLGIDEVLDWAGMVLNRVDRARFFSKFEEEHAVQYFYEPFLKTYDPELRKELGVWYTPPEIVKYQVERIDKVLREELNIADGLADEQVVVLDPCCGTGAYLVEVLRRIHKTLAEKGASALTAQNVKEAARKRVFGFEILPAPFVISHLQIGLMLRTIGAPLNAEGSERAGVYLTNALTGWEPLEDPKTLLPFPELKEERDKANKVKQDAPILVILGNPPYNAFAGISPEEEGGLVDCYKEGLTTSLKEGGWGIKKFNLDDLYVRFFRIAERRIVKSGKGIVSFISNYSWTQEPSFVVLRKRLLESFDKFWVENMHGNRTMSEYAPDGHTSETIFAIKGFSPGIQQGIVISLWVREERHKNVPERFGKVQYRDDINAARAIERREELLESLGEKNFENIYNIVQPRKENKFSFLPSNVSEDYLGWSKVNDLCEELPFVGVEECRGGVLIDYEKETLQKRLNPYFDKKVKWEEIRELEPKLEKATEDTRKNIIQKEGYRPNNLLKIILRPFDVRWCYHTTISSLWNRPRPQLRKQLEIENKFFVSRFNTQAKPEGVPFLFTTSLLDKQTINRNPGAMPLFLKVEKKKSKDDDGMTTNFLGDNKAKVEIKANLSKDARDYLKKLKFNDPDTDKDSAEAIWMHALAIGYSPAYLEENADGIRQDWPRIPLPKTKKALLESAELGRRVAALLDTEQPVEGVTKGKIDERLKSIGVIRRVAGGTIQPEKGELDLTAGWGHSGKGGVCMPGKGDCKPRKQEDDELRRVFGDETLDIYLNGAAYWENVPKCVWEYYIGGYQVIKKWLSYREKTMLGRGLKVEEAEYVTEMARRLASLVLLQEKLNANYEVVKQETWSWSDQR